MVVQIITWLLFFALLYLLITSMIFLRNRYDLISLSSEKKSGSLHKISVCIPARNEEATIGNLLNSLEHQSWPDYTVHVMDDGSTDDTFTIAKFYQKKYPEVFLAHKGKSKPAGWHGKSWACHQLSKKADGEILVFLDADTELEPASLQKISTSFQKHKLDMLTVWPKQKLVTFWEKTLIPVVYHTLITLLPAIYVYRDPRWMPAFLQNYFRPKFAAACGQCIAFKRDAYQSIGGHESVKYQVVEDVKLAQQIKRRGLTMRMFNGLGSVSCRMYRTENEIFEGFRKNFLAGFGNSITAFVLAGLLHLVVFVLPFVAIFISVIIPDPVIFFLSAASISLILIQRLILAIWYQMDPLYSLTHPIGVLWFQWLGIVKIRDYLSGKPLYWKDRKI